jgi:hypothetical protein
MGGIGEKGKRGKEKQGERRRAKKRNKESNKVKRNFGAQYAPYISKLETKN